MKKTYKNSKMNYENQNKFLVFLKMKMIKTQTLLCKLFWRTKNLIPVSVKPNQKSKKTEDKDETKDQQNILNNDLTEEQQQKLTEGQTSNPEEDRDKRSVFVKNVHFSAEKKEIELFFADRECKVNNITILTDNFTR